MRQMIMKPELHQFETCREFAEAFQIGEGDLVLTNRFIYEPYFGELGLKADVIFQEEFGNGEPTDEMFEAICAAVKPEAVYKRVIGIGGGTVLDIAKLLVLKDCSPIAELYEHKREAVKEKKLCLIPTTCGNDIRTRAKAKAAAGSDARMNGCELPVIINSGSGNQGITVSIPVIEYAKEVGTDGEHLLRALALSNLTAIHQKTGIGTLSAYCGAVSAGAGAGAGIAYLCGGTYEEVVHTVVNALAIVSGIVCDGAKASCAAKIASSVDAAILGYNMYKRGQEFRRGDGIVMQNIEETIRGIGRLGKDGMKETNEEIIKLMVGE